MAGSCYLSDSSVPALHLTVTVINVPGFQGMSMHSAYDKISPLL